MKIADFQDKKFPCRVKITEGFTLDESIDPGFVVDIIQVKIERSWGARSNCYKIWFNIPPELIPICTKVAKADWLDDNRQHTWNYFQANSRFNRNGTYQDTAYVMEEDDWFEFYEEPEFTTIKVLSDNEGELYFVPQELWDEWEGLEGAIGSFDEECDEQQELYDKFDDVFRKYKMEGSVSDYQLLIAKSDLDKITN